MTLDELDAEARMHGLHVWMSRGMASTAVYAVVRPSRFDSGCSETLVADDVEGMRAKLEPWYGRGRHAAGPVASEVAETAKLEQPYTGRRRRA